MDFILLIETWIVLAIICAIAEIFIPGGILLNLAISSSVVATAIYFKWLDTWVLTLTTWFILSSVLLFVMFFVTEKLFSGEQTIENTDENLDIFGKDVTVIESIGPGTTAGRVEFQGTTWSALGDGSKIPQGSHAKVVCQENISLIVEPIK